MALICPRYISFAWGFAEGTVFFLVPDIWLSYIVLQNPKQAYINIAYAVCGTILGGLLMYYVGTAYFDEALAAMHFIPAISPELTTQTGQTMQSQSFLAALMSGMFAGVPYKVYALFAGQAGISIILFIAATTIARVARFITVTGGAHLISIPIKRAFGVRGAIIAHVTLWLIFYAFYFYVMGF